MRPARLQADVHLTPTFILNRSPAGIAEGMPQTCTLAICAPTTKENDAAISSKIVSSSSTADRTARQVCSPITTGALRLISAAKTALSVSASSALASSISSAPRIKTRCPTRSKSSGDVTLILTVRSAPASTSDGETSAAHVLSACSLEASLVMTSLRCIGVPRRRRKPSPGSDVLPTVELHLDEVNDGADLLGAERPNDDGLGRRRAERRAVARGLRVGAPK